MAVSTGTLLGRYEIISPLGAGGMGEVYLAHDKQLNRRVAVKFPTVKSDEHHAYARFIREARAVSTLSHPHIATIYDYGETEAGQPFIVMELIKGQSLSDLLHKSELTLARAVEIIADVADALAEAHHHGIIHRDIKPSNVMINERGDVKVLDFGLAKQINEERYASADPEAATLLETHTQSGIVVGTPLYLSPEQATGDAVDTRSDLFALGALLYECITGRPAFSGKNVIEIVAQVIHVAPLPPSTFNKHIPPELDRINLKALAKEPEARYQSADDLSADLRDSLSTLSGIDHQITQRIRRSPRTHGASALTTLSDLMRRPRLSFLTILIVAILASLFVGGYFYWHRRSLHQPSAEAKLWYDRGTSALRDGAYYQASKMLERSISADNEYALAHARYAEALTELDYLDKARAELLEANRVAPDRSLLPKVDQLRLDAITATAQRDFKSAVKSYEEIMPLTSDQKTDQAEAYVDLGRAYENNEEIKKAIESYLKATTLDSQSPTAFLRVAILYGRQKDTASASIAFDKADELYQAQQHIEGSAQVHYQRGAMLSDGKNYPEADKETQQSLDIARTLHYEAQEIMSLLQLSYIYCYEGHTPQAKQLAQEAVELAKTRRMENLTAHGLIDLGGAFLATRDYAEVEKYYKQALDTARSYHGQQYEKRALLALGSLYILKGATDEGLANVESSLDFFKTGNYRTETSYCFSLIGRAKRDKGDYQGALQSFEQLLQFATEANDQSQISIADREMGNLLAMQERYTEALPHYQNRYAFSKASGDELGINYSLLNQGQALWQLGRYPEAQQVLSQAEQFAARPEGGNKGLLADIILTKGQMALSQHNFADAKKFAQQALDTLPNPDKKLEVDAKLTLGLAQFFSDAKREGREKCEEALAIATQSGNPQLISRASLSLAETLLEDGDGKRAQDLASQAQEAFARVGQKASEWRALLLLARIAHLAGDEAKAHDYAQRAADALTNLGQRWDAASYTSYIARDDVQYYRKQLRAFIELK